MQISSKMDQLLAKAEAISDSGSTSMIIYLRTVVRGKLWATAEISENMWSDSAETKVHEEVDGGGTPPEQWFSCSL